MAGKVTSNEEHDGRFAEGEDPAGRMAERRVSLSMPAWLVEAVDAKARHVGADRQSYINMTLAESVK